MKPTLGDNLEAGSLTLGGAGALAGMASTGPAGGGLGGGGDVASIRAGARRATVTSVSRSPVRSGPLRPTKRGGESVY